jgi:hypothetical protein
MAKARKRTKESSVQTEKAKTDLCDNEVTVADLTGGMQMYQCYFSLNVQCVNSILTHMLYLQMFQVKRTGKS